MVDGQLKTLLVHRKGSTRAFPPHHPLIPVDYQVRHCRATIEPERGPHLTPSSYIPVDYQVRPWGQL